MDLDGKVKGSWLVHHTRKLDLVSYTNPYGAIRVAGKSGLLLSALSENAQSSLDKALVEQLAGASGIDKTFELPILLNKLEAQHLISQSPNGIDVLGLTSSAVLKHTSDIFNNESPSNVEQAAITMAEVCSDKPQDGSFLTEFISDTHRLSSKEMNSLLDDTIQIGFADSESIGNEVLYFNGSIFRRGEVSKIQKVLTSLKSEEERLVQEAHSLLSSKGCMLYSEMVQILGLNLSEKLLSVGMFELSEVSNSREQTVYVTRPSAFCKFGDEPAEDAFDLAKALVASLTYGMQRSSSSRGRIIAVNALLGSLINGRWVGPASAIGEDYKILELKKVIKVKRDRYGFSMKLLKVEVGQIALAAITQGDASEHSLNLPGASVSKYRGPEDKRTEVRHKTKTHMKPHEITDILQSLRTGS